MSINQDAARPIDHRRQTRLDQAKKFRALYRYLGYTAATLADFLQVSEASVYRWQRDGNVPTLVLRFLRLLAHQDLPGKTWEGWHFSRGTLWSPEAHGFDGKDFAWLSLTLRKASMFPVLYRERGQLQHQLKSVRLQLADAEQRACAAEGRAGLLELAVTGALWGMPEAHPERARERLLQDPSEGDVLVTRHQLLMGEQPVSKSLI